MLGAVTEDAKVFAPFVSWSVLPPLLTGSALRALYTTGILSRPADQRAAAVQQNRVRAAVVLAYLFYNFYSSVSSLPPNHYELLDVPLDADEVAVKASFRRLARKFHPDKVGPQGEAYFIHVRRAFDTLQDPVKRFAYDRFGPSVLEWRQAVSVREHIVTGLQSSLAFYIVNPIIYAVIGWLNGQAGQNFWRLSLLFMLASMELILLVSPTRPPWIASLLPTTTSHQLVQILHQFFVAIIMAMTHAAPFLLGPRVPMDGTAEEQLNALMPLVDRVEKIATATQNEASRVLAADLRPFRPRTTSSAPTLREAAASAASSASRSNTTPAAAPAPARARTRHEDTFIHLFSELVFRLRLGSVPVVRAALYSSAGARGAKGSADGENHVPPAASNSSEPKQEQQEQQEQEQERKPESGDRETKPTISETAPRASHLPSPPPEDRPSSSTSTPLVAP